MLNQVQHDVFFYLKGKIMALTFSWTDVPEEYDNLPAPQLGTPEQTFNPQKFGNTLFIGDNYPVLKALVAQGLKVNLIYIDPPYNTGKSFVYKDNLSQDAWLSFMQRRLLLAGELLYDDGCIFIAIDQSQLYELKILCDQIFGPENFVNDFMWLHGKGKKDKWSRTLQQHTLCYAKNKKNLPAFFEVEYSSWATKNIDNDPRGNWFSGSISFDEKRSNPNHRNFFTITSPSGKVWTRQWQVSQEEMTQLIEENKIYWGPAPDYDRVPRKKVFNETPTEVIPRNIIDEVETTRAAQAHLDKMLGKIGKKSAFDNPKPVGLICHLIKITQAPKDAVILDFFAGSGTTFESVCQLNAEDGGNRRCLLVQKDENGIADLCRLRCQKVAEKYGIFGGMIDVFQWKGNVAEVEKRFDGGGGGDCGILKKKEMPDSRRSSPLLCL